MQEEMEQMKFVNKMQARSSLPSPPFGSPGRLFRDLLYLWFPDQPQAAVEICSLFPWPPGHVAPGLRLGHSWSGTEFPLTQAFLWQWRVSSEGRLFTGAAEVGGPEFPLEATARQAHLFNGNTSGLKQRTRPGSSSPLMR